jgi:hypothetical protein
VDPKNAWQKRGFRESWEERGGGAKNEEEELERSGETRTCVIRSSKERTPRFLKVFKLAFSLTEVAPVEEARR